jgi:hypothetical protein
VTASKYGIRVDDESRATLDLPSHSLSKNARVRLCLRHIYKYVRSQTTQKPFFPPALICPTSLMHRLFEVIPAQLHPTGQSVGVAQEYDPEVAEGSLQAPVR